VRKIDGGVEVEFHSFLTSALDGDEWSVSHPGCFTASTHLTEGWVGARFSLDMVVRRKNFRPFYE